METCAMTLMTLLLTISSLLFPQKQYSCRLTYSQYSIIMIPYSDTMHYSLTILPLFHYHSIEMTSMTYSILTCDHSATGDSDTLDTSDDVDRHLMTQWLLFWYSVDCSSLAVELIVSDDLVMRCWRYCCCSLLVSLGAILLPLSICSLMIWACWWKSVWPFCYLQYPSVILLFLWSPQKHLTALGHCSLMTLSSPPTDPVTPLLFSCVLSTGCWLQMWWLFQCWSLPAITFDSPFGLKPLKWLCSDLSFDTIVTWCWWPLIWIPISRLLHWPSWRHIILFWLWPDDWYLLSLLTIVPQSKMYCNVDYWLK